MIGGVNIYKMAFVGQTEALCKSPCCMHACSSIQLGFRCTTRVETGQATRHKVKRCYRILQKGSSSKGPRQRFGAHQIALGIPRFLLRLAKSQTKQLQQHWSTCIPGICACTGGMPQSAFQHDRRCRDGLLRAPSSSCQTKR